MTRVLSRYMTVIPTSGPDGNIFMIIANASKHLREVGEPPEVIEGMRKRAMVAHTYRDACDVVREFFRLEMDS
jgi:hypothetical protein